MKVINLKPIIMQFTTIQDKETLKVTRYYVEGKRVKRNTFLHLEHIQMLGGGKYSSSLTNRTAIGNFRHSASL